jgi:hypothetical protein
MEFINFETLKPPDYGSSNKSKSNCDYNPVPKSQFVPPPNLLTLVHGQSPPIPERQ